MVDFAKLKRQRQIERMRAAHVARLESAEVVLPGVLAGRELPPSELILDGIVRVREIHTDMLFSDAKAALDGEDKPISALQRELRIGYERAKQLIEDVTIGRYMVEVNVRGIGWVSAGVVLATGWHRVADAIRCLPEEVSSINTKTLWRAIQRSLGLKWTAPWETRP